MANLRSRGLLFAFVAVAAVLVGGLVMGRDGETPAVASGPSGDFTCMLHGITTLIMEEESSPSDYVCTYGGEGWGCDYAAIPGVVSCSLNSNPDHRWTCGVFPTGGAADCSDEGEGSYYCADIGGSMNCTDATPAIDFFSCGSNSELAYACVTEVGWLLCADNGFSQICGILSSSLRLWGDADCSGQIGARDNQALLRNVLSQNALSQTEPCPDVGVITATGGGGLTGSTGTDPDTLLGCTNPGVGMLMLDAETFNYGCNYDGSGFFCEVTDPSLTCTSGLVSATCTVTGDTADCQDNEGGAQTCTGTTFLVACSGPSELDVSGCSFGAESYVCEMANDSFVCLETLGHYDCFTVPVMVSPWMDVDCNGSVTARDNQALLRNVLGQVPLSQTEPCPNVADGVIPAEG